MITLKPRIYLDKTMQVWCCKVGEWGVCGATPLDAFNNLMDLFSARGLAAQAT